jgi:hypothetical protein
MTFAPSCFCAAFMLQPNLARTQSRQTETLSKFIFLKSFRKSFLESNSLQ